MASTPQPNLIRTVAAVIQNPHGEVLLVRKRGSDFFIQPGGKPEPGEQPLQTLIREVDEELGVTVIPESVVFLGEFEEKAVHEAATRVRSNVFLAKIQGEPTARAEIVELLWVNPHDHGDINIAPLSARHILPRVARMNAQKTTN